MSATKTAILATYRNLLKTLPWAADEAELERFMQAAHDTLHGGNAIDRTGHNWKLALERNGLFSAKSQTLKALHALPEGGEPAAQAALGFMRTVVNGQA